MDEHGAIVELVTPEHGRAVAGEKTAPVPLRQSEIPKGMDGLVFEPGSKIGL
jgi:hypothetical protein